MGDLFKMVRYSAVPGFGGGFLGAAVGSLRPHPAGRGTSGGGRGWDPVTARQLDFAARADQLLRSGQRPVDSGTLARVLREAGLDEESIGNT
ncbi:hypothetical protein [Nocardia sp. NPDC004604]|uniref:hypothetical protein n=1 Tax=Nocardia sp. NPDC004604 TaxID=3157013 RepID=UPI0033A9A1FC